MTVVDKKSIWLRKGKGYTPHSIDCYHSHYIQGSTEHTSAAVDSPTHTGGRSFPHHATILPHPTLIH